MSLKRKHTEESDSPLSKRKRVEISTSRKREICMYKQSNPSVLAKSMVDHFHEKWGIKIGQSTFSGIIANREKWLSMELPKTECTRYRHGQLDELEDVLYSWCIDTSGPRHTLSDDVVIQKAKDIGAEKNVTGFVFSKGWLYRFRKRYGVPREMIRGLVDPSVKIPDLHQENTDVSSPIQRQKAVSAFFTSKQVLPFGFAEQSCDTLRDDTILRIQHHDTVQEPDRFEGSLTIKESSVRSVDINSWNDSAECEDAQSDRVNFPQMITTEGQIKKEVQDDLCADLCDPLRNDTTSQTHIYKEHQIQENKHLVDVDLNVESPEQVREYTIQEPSKCKGHITINELNESTGDMNSWKDSGRCRNIQRNHSYVPQIVTEDKAEVRDEEHHIDLCNSSKPVEQQPVLGVIECYGDQIKEKICELLHDTDSKVETREPCNIKEKSVQEIPDMMENDVLISPQDAKASLCTVMRFLQQNPGLIHLIDSTLPKIQAVMDTIMP